MTRRLRIEEEATEVEKVKSELGETEKDSGGAQKWKFSALATKEPSTGRSPVNWETRRVWLERKEQHKGLTIGQKKFFRAKFWNYKPGMKGAVPAAAPA